MTQQRAAFTDKISMVLRAFALGFVLLFCWGCQSTKNSGTTVSRDIAQDRSLGGSCVGRARRLLSRIGAAEINELVATLTKRWEEAPAGYWGEGRDQVLTKLDLKVALWRLEGYRPVDIQRIFGVNILEQDASLFRLAPQFPFLSIDDFDLVIAREIGLKDQDSLETMFRAMNPDELSVSDPVAGRLGERPRSVKNTKPVSDMSKIDLEQFLESVKDLRGKLGEDLLTTTFIRARGVSLQSQNGVKLDEFGNPGVTKAEAMVAILLLEGMKLPDASREINTAKTTVVRYIDAVRNRYPLFPNNAMLRQVPGLRGFPDSASVLSRLTDAEAEILMSLKDKP